MSLSGAISCSCTRQSRIKVWRRRSGHQSKRRYCARAQGRRDAPPGRKLRGDLDDPATTLTLLRANADVGVTEFFNSDGTLKSVGIQCALCHSTADNSLAFGLSHRLDGPANRDLDTGEIIASAPDLMPIANALRVRGVGGLVQSSLPSRTDRVVYHLQSSSSSTIANNRVRPWRPDSYHGAFGTPGAVLCHLFVCGRHVDPGSVLDNAGDV